MKKLLMGGSLIAMTAAELATGRYMRAPDGHEGGGDVATPPAPAPAAPANEPTGGEVNDSVEVESDNGNEFKEPGGGQPPAGEDDSDGSGADEEGAQPKSPAEADQSAQRISELERIAAEHVRDRDYWKGLAEGTINEDGSPVNPPADERAIAPDDPDRPNPDDYQYGETDAGYIRDLASYEARRAFAEERRTEKVTQQLQEVETQHTERVAKARERYTDYDDVVVKGADPDPVTKEPKWFCSQLMTLGIKTSEQGPDIAYHLASNPEESLRVARLSPLEQAKEFGRLEYRFEQEAKANESGGDQSSTRVTGAPPPPPRAKGAGGTTSIDPATDDFGAFEQRADAHLKTKKRR